MITIDERDLKQKLNDAYYNVKYFCKTHPYEAVMIGTTIVGLAASGVKGINKIQTRRAERFHTEREIYDPNTGSYITIKHKMNSEDHLAYERLIRQGVGRAEALRILQLI